MAASKPETSFSEDEHKYIFEQEGVTLALTRFHDSTRDGGLTCELTVDHTTGRLKQPSRTNLLAEQTITRLGENLAKRTDGLGIDWGAILTLVADVSVRKYRAGDPPVPMSSGSAWRERPRYMLYPLVGFTGDTVLFAHGGSGKSMMALIIAVQLASGVPIIPTTSNTRQCNVLYLDWEADLDDHTERLAAILRGFEPPIELPSEDAILYKHMTASLNDAVDVVRAYVLKHNIGLIVVDSIGKARGGNPNDPEETLKLFNALRRCGCPGLLIDHMSKGSIDSGQGATMPIGTVYTHNSARMTWALEVPDTVDDSQWTDEWSTASITLANKKNNNGRLHHRIGVDLSFYAVGNDDSRRLDAVYVNGFDPLQRRGFFHSLSLYERCQRMLEEQGPSTARQLGEWLGARSGEIDRVLRSMPERFDLEGVYWQVAANAGNVREYQSEVQWFAE